MKLNSTYITRSCIARSQVSFQRVSANWVVGQLPPTLNELTFDVAPSSLCALAGNVGSGKSAILSVLLRELPVGAGSVCLSQRQRLPPGPDASNNNKPGFHADNPGLRISYASQDPWLFSATVRENILFGQPYDAARYNEVSPGPFIFHSNFITIIYYASVAVNTINIIALLTQVTEACALRQDFEQLARGDQTLVGERGASLSGGQRARINLARACYRRADLYLLDDPLSAVDPRVARHLFERCIEGYLRSKTRILVTHQLQFLRRADSIVYVERVSHVSVCAITCSIAMRDFVLVLPSSN